MTIKKPIYIIIGVVIAIVLLFAGFGFADLIENIYEQSAGHWIAVIVLSILGGVFCSFVPLLLFFVGEVKNGRMSTSILIGLVGGPIILIMFGFERIPEYFSAVFMASTFMGVMAVKDEYH